jgi:hypothetical protein
VPFYLLVTCHNFLNLHLCFSKLPKLGMSLLMPESVILFAANLHAEAIEAIKSRAALLASSS